MVGCCMVDGRLRSVEGGFRDNFALVRWCCSGAIDGEVSVREVYF